MYVLTGKFTWQQIANQLAGVAYFASANPMSETVTKKTPCGLAPGETQFHLLHDMESDLVYICLHSDGLCIQHRNESVLAERVFEALRGHLVAASPG